MRTPGYQGRQFTPWKATKPGERRKLSPEVLAIIKAREEARRRKEARLELLLHLTRLATDPAYRKEWQAKYAYRGIGEWSEHHGV